MDDQRFDDLKRELKADIKSVANDVSSIRDMLISEPEASPMGRALIKRSIDNRAATQELRQDFEKYIETHEHFTENIIEKRINPMYDWWNQQRGSWKAFQGLALVLGMIGAFFGILAYFGVRPA